MGDVAPPSSAGPVRRAKSPLVSQVSMAEFVYCVCVCVCVCVIILELAVHVWSKER